METLGIILSLIGLIVSVVGLIWLLVVAFRTHLLWRLACLFIPFASLIFLVFSLIKICLSPSVRMRATPLLYLFRCIPPPIFCVNIPLCRLYF